MSNFGKHTLLILNIVQVAVFFYSSCNTSIIKDEGSGGGRETIKKRPPHKGGLLHLYSVNTISLSRTHPRLRASCGNVRGRIVRAFEDW
jgi:hypothetical protein